MNLYTEYVQLEPRMKELERVKVENQGNKEKREKDG
jgi:hypothetical protein